MSTKLYRLNPTLIEENSSMKIVYSLLFAVILLACLVPACARELRRDPMTGRIRILYIGDPAYVGPRPIFERDPMTTVLPILAITSPVNGAILNHDLVTVTGTAQDTHLSQVKVNGQVASLSDGSFTAEVDYAGQEGSFTITVA